MPFLPAPPPTDMPPGDVIFERAEAVWHAQALPAYIEFTTFIAQISTDPVRVAVRTTDGRAYVQTIPLTPNDRPVVYPGVHLAGPENSPLGICVSTERCMGVIGSDPFGELAAQAPEELRTIAKARVFINPYEIVQSQYMDFDGTPVYDLKLAAQQYPDRYRMREIVIDAKTYHVWKMIYAEPQYPNLMISYGFGPVQDIWYLRQACHAVPTHFSGLSVPACTPDAAMMWDYQFPKTMPDYYFDRSLYIQQSQNPVTKR